MAEIIRITGAPKLNNRPSLLGRLLGIGDNAISGTKRKGHYGVKDIGGAYHVVYQFTDGETLIMSDRYKTPERAMKKLNEVRFQAGNNN